MTDPSERGAAPADEEFGIHLIATGGEEWSVVLDGPDPCPAEREWRDFNPQGARLTPLAQVLVELSGKPMP